MKWFLFLCLFLFIFPIVGRFLLRSLLWMLGASAIKLAQKEYQNAHTGTNQRTNGQARSSDARRKPEGTVDIDFIPDKNGKKPRPQDFKGGEYVDYEEVK
jgi:hypothetical protein